jgi:hypothetical protein
VDGSDFDTGPHSIISLLAVCGLSHRKSYPNIFATTMSKVVIISLVFFSKIGSG